MAAAAPHRPGDGKLLRLKEDDCLHLPAEHSRQGRCSVAPGPGGNCEGWPWLMLPSALPPTTSSPPLCCAPGLQITGLTVRQPGLQLPSPLDTPSPMMIQQLPENISCGGGSSVQEGCGSCCPLPPAKQGPGVLHSVLQLPKVQHPELLTWLWPGPRQPPTAPPMVPLIPGRPKEATTCQDCTGCDQ